MHKNYFIVLIVCTILLISMLFFLTKNHAPDQSRSSQSDSTQISVVTTLFPLYDFAKNVGGDHVNVILLLPPGVEAHAFEPTPHDMITINEADLFVYTGKFMEPWANDTIKSATNAQMISIDTSSGITLTQEKNDHEKPIQEEEHHDGIDPHIWLDLDNAQKMVDTITTALIKKDPVHATEYQSNAIIYKEKLKALDHTYATSLTNCASREIVYGGHYAFGYLSAKYDLSYETAYGISPDAEPSAHDLALLIEQVKEDHVTTIFYEELLSPKVAETIAQETGTQLRMLNPAHNITKEEFENGTTFITIMENNLQNLTYGLSCK